jgi:hypothetical protein
MGFSWSDLNPGSDHRDDDAAKKALSDTNTNWRNSAAQYQAGSSNIMGQAATDAATNYYGNAASVYGQQQQAAQMLQNQANGTAPSAAQIQMGLGLGQANQQAQAAALSQQGGVLSGNTQRNMLNAQSMNSQNVLGQTGALRAQEQVSGQQAYAQLLSNMQNQQLQQGQLQYRQGQDFLDRATATNQSNYDVNTQAKQQQYGNSIGEINGDAARRTAATNQAFNTAAQVGAAVATGGASTAASGAAGMLGGGSSGSSVSHIIKDPDTGNYVTAPGRG